MRDVTDAGDAVVETSEGLVMVSGGLPDEQVRVRVVRSRAGVLHGSLLAVLSASPERVAAACSLAERCGGCPLMPLALSAQHALKARRVGRAVEGLGGPALQVSFESNGPSLTYRRRARLAFRRLGAALVLGYRAHGRSQLVDVAHCPVLTLPLQAALVQLREVLAPALTGSGEIELDGVSEAAVHVSVRCDVAVAPAAYRAAEALALRAPIVGVALAVADGAPACYGETPEAGIAHDGAPLWAKAHGFSQVNAAVNARLRELVLELAEPQDSRVLELYAGHGNFSLSLSAQASRLLAVEGDAGAVQACRANLRARDRAHAQVLLCDVRELSARERYDVVVLDPPRGGCPNLSELVQQARPQRVVYVSCHMTTLGRDLRALQAQGFRADRVHALDMFPQTGHVEAVVRMQRSAG